MALVMVVKIKGKQLKWRYLDTGYSIFYFQGTLCILQLVQIKRTILTWVQLTWGPGEGCYAKPDKLVYIHVQVTKTYRHSNTSTGLPMAIDSSEYIHKTTCTVSTSFFHPHNVTNPSLSHLPRARNFRLISFGPTKLRRTRWWFHMRSLTSQLRGSQWRMKEFRECAEGSGRKGQAC